MGNAREAAQGRAATLAYAETFGEAGAGGTVSYYLASAFEKVLTALQSTCLCQNTMARAVLVMFDS